MAQIGTMRVANGGTIYDLPVFEPADVGNPFLRVSVGGTVGMLPMYPVADEPTYDWFRVEYGGTVYGCHDSATLFAPDDIASLNNWYDATEVSATDGDRISTWANQQAVMDLTNGTGTNSNMPTYTANFQNGHPVLYFNETEKNWLAGSLSTHMSQPTTFVFAIRHDGNSGTDYVCDGPPDGTGRQIVWSNNGTEMDGYAGSTFTSTHVSGSFDIYTYIFDGANSVIRANGTDVTSSDSGGGTTGCGGLTIGSRYNAPSEIGEVYAGEWCMFDARFTASEIDDMDAYLADKWAWRSDGVIDRDPVHNERRDSGLSS